MSEVFRVRGGIWPLLNGFCHKVIPFYVFGGMVVKTMNDWDFFIKLTMSLLK